MKTKNLLRKSRYSLGVIARIFGRGEVEKKCPCCGYMGPFETRGTPPRYGALCPFCNSYERHRMLALTDHEEKIFTNKEVLHFAPENALSCMINTCAKRYLTADITPGRADCILNIEQIDQPDESWDVVLCSHVLEHVNDRKALKEIHRILHYGGLLIIMVPIIEGWENTYENPAITSEKDRQLHFGQIDHVRYYGRDIRERIKNIGFSIREYTANGSNVVEYGLLRGEKVFVCLKQKKG